LTLLECRQSVAKGRGKSMLVLSRKNGEKILIGDNISITVVEIDHNKVRLGIEAPREVPIYREELKAYRLDSESKEESSG
jgi:carbon storage regulator